MEHRLWAGLLVVLLVGTGVGFVISQNGDTDATEPASSDIRTTHGTLGSPIQTGGGSTADPFAGPWMLSVGRAKRTLPVGRTVAFADLGSGQQRVFERALGDETGSTRIPDDVDAGVWLENRGVRYRNRTYAVAVSAP